MKKGPVVNANKNIYYKDVYVFIKGFKNIGLIRGVEKRRNVIFQCFRGFVFIWHSIEVFDRDKRLYRTPSFEKWYDILVAHFKKRTFLVLIKMQTVRFTMADAKTKKDFNIYIQNVACFA